MKVTNTKQVELQKLRFLVYGSPGVGKTTLASTIDAPTLLISAESGLLSLSGKDIDVIDISTDDNGDMIPKERRMERLGKVFQFLLEEKTRQKYDWVFIDSMTEISQNLVDQLSEVYPEKKESINMWGDYSKKARALVKSFRDIPYYNIVFTALDKTEKDENNRRFLQVDMAGKIGQQLPAFFDEVFYMGINKDNGDRYLLTQPRENIVAKDRSGKLNMIESPNLKAIVAKIRQTKPIQKPPTTKGE